MCENVTVQRLSIGMRFGPASVILITAVESSSERFKGEYYLLADEANGRLISFEMKATPICGPGEIEEKTLRAIGEENLSMKAIDHAENYLQTKLVEHGLKGVITENVRTEDFRPMVLVGSWMNQFEEQLNAIAENTQCDELRSIIRLRKKVSFF